MATDFDHKLLIQGLLKDTVRDPVIYVTLYWKLKIQGEKEREKTNFVDDNL